MNIAALYHRASDNWCFALDGATLRLRVQTAVDDVATLHLVAGDPFAWKDGAWAHERAPLVKRGSDGVHDYWEVDYRPPRRRTKYYFEVVGASAGPSETWVFGERGILPASAAQDRHRNAFVFPYLHDAEVFRAPAWVAGTVWYQVFPERFALGDPPVNSHRTRPWGPGPVTNKEFYGGDLRGVTAHLDHLADLGVGGLYLTPIFTAPSVHKYDTTDYLTVDPAFGTLDDLRTLVNEAHRRGLRVILDAVFNHSGTGFFAWQDVLARGPASPYAPWFHIHHWEAGRPADYETFSYVRGMPKLNTRHPALREYLLGVARYWLREAGIDGWRLDVANEVDAEFWREFRRVVKAENPEAYIVGEVWHDSLPWLRGDQFDAVMNYRSANAISDFVLATNGALTAADFVRAVTAIEASYPLPVLRSAFNVLDSHDTDRFITRCGGDRARARLGWLLLFCLPGTPCLYYGSEIGLEGGQDPDNRRCMLWDTTDPVQYGFLQALARLRRAEAPVFDQGERHYLTDPADPDLLGLEIRWGTRGLVTWLRRSAQPGAWPTVAGREVLRQDGPYGFRVFSL